jgi:AcrR family transcriptional regulator
MSAATKPSTRERILEISLELFAEQGYDKTSLRDIAERLGTTKAALYYHFARKEDILLELHLQLHALGRGMLEELAGLDGWEAKAAAWPRLLDEFIVKIADHRDLLLVHTTNPGPMRDLDNSERHKAENAVAQDAIRELMMNPDAPLDQRVRIVSSFGAVLTGLVDPGNFFDDVSTEALAAEVRAVVADLFR